MDKRTLLFVVSLSLTLFVVNFFFSYWEQQRNQTWVTQREAKQAKREKELLADLKAKREAVGQLPLVPLYADEAGTQQVATAVRAGEGLVVLRAPGTPSERLYSRQPTAAFALAATEANKEPLLYYRPEKGDLSLAELPDVGAQELLLFVPGPSQITFATYQDGVFSLAAQEFTQEELRAAWEPKGNALVLMKSATGYLPVGAYQAQEQHFLSSDELSLPSGTRLVSSHLAEAIPQPTTGEESFYVLEDEYQQLVFSSVGGAIVEINLPLKSRDDPLSVVRPIEIDREMAEKQPHNDLFPGRSASVWNTTANQAEPLESKLGGYYPLLRRQLVGRDGKPLHKLAPHYYAFNLVSEYPEVAELVYQVKSFSAREIVFEAVQRHRRITKTFRLPQTEKQAPYSFELDIAIEGDSRGLWLTSGVPDVELISGAPAPTVKYRFTRQGQAEVEPVDLPKDTLTMSSILPDWVCTSNGFFGIILDPVSEMDPGFKVLRLSGMTLPSRLMLLDPQNDRFKAKEMAGFELLLPLRTKGGTTRFRVFAGPFAKSVLETVDQAFADPITGETPDFIACQSFHGWFAFISAPFAQFLFLLMRFFHSLTGSWGVSIILLTAALRVMLYPLNGWSIKSALAMKEIAPEVTAIQERYQKDPKKAQLALVALYRERGINPLSGCFPMLIQLPFLIGMFDLLKSTFELRGASFIPGWIDNLAAPDVLFTWTTPIFFFGNAFHLLPVLLGVVMFIQAQLMSPLPKDSKLWTDQQRQQRAMGNIMTVVFTVAFYHFPAGLNLYWLSSTVFGILQQWITNRRASQRPTKPGTIEVRGSRTKA